MAELVFRPAVQSLLDEAASRIRGHAKRTLQAVVEIGRELITCRALIGEGRLFDQWIEDEFAWSRASAYRFISVAERSPNLGRDDLSIDLSALYLLCQAGTPPAVIDRAATMAGQGQRVTHADVRRMMERPEEPRPEPAPQRPVSPLVGKLRDIDLMESEPAALAATVEQPLRPLLANRARRLSAWLGELADALEAA